jgi:hypothetical protein
MDSRAGNASGAHDRFATLPYLWALAANLLQDFEQLSSRAASIRQIHPA